MTTSRIGAPPGNASHGVLARHPLVSFLHIAYADASLLELPVALSCLLSNRPTPRRLHERVAHWVLSLKESRAVARRDAQERACS